jgi:hypothetical protein
MLPFLLVQCSVADPNPDPSDPYVFGPPGSGSGSEVWIRIRIQILLLPSKNSEKNHDSYCFMTSFRLLSLKNGVNVLSEKQNNFFKGSDQ